MFRQVLAAGAFGCLVFSSAALGADFPVSTQILDQGGTGFPGSKVAVSGKWAVVGNGGSRCRADVYEFDYATSLWGDGAGTAGDIVETLNDGGNCGAAPFGGFAESVAVAGDVILVGAPRSKPQGTNLTEVGSFYIYTYDGSAWVEQHRVDNPVVDEGALFAWDLAIHLPEVNPNVVFIAVGVPGYDTNTADDVGAAYFYTYDLGVPATAPIPLERYEGENAGDAFGTSVDINIDFLTVGAPNYDEAGPPAYTDSGAVYLFDASDPANTTPVQTISQPDVDQGGSWQNGWSLGLHVAQKGDLLMIGAEQSYTLQRTGPIGAPAFTLLHTFGITDHPFSLFRDVSLGDGLQAYAYSGLVGGVALWEEPASGSVPSIQIPSEGEGTYGNSIDLDSSRLLVNGEQSDVAYAYTFICGGGVDVVQHMVWKTVSIPCAPPSPGSYTVAQVFGDLGDTVGTVPRENADYLVWEQNGIDWDGNRFQNVLLNATDEVHQDRGYWLIWRDQSMATTENTWNVGSAANPTRTPTDPTYATGSPYTTPIIGHLILYPENDAVPNNRLPIGDGTTRRSVLLGNPFDKPMDFSKVLVADPTVFPDGLNRLIGTDDGKQIVEAATAWVYDTVNFDIPSGQFYRAVVASATPGFGQTLQPYEGFWIKLLPASEEPFVFLPLDF